MQSTRILDGGMGQELIRRSKRPVTPMWSADIMLNEPHLVRDLHREFIDSGAQIITLNTYTATPQRLKRDGAADALAPLHESAMQVATDAITRAGNPQVQIAGCLPPLVASYHPDTAPDFSESLDTYRQLVRLQAPVCDIFICETMASLTEARAACAAASESGKEVWVAFTVCDDLYQILRSGESLAQGLQAIAGFNPDAVLLNCSRPEAINASLPLLASLPCQMGAYANGFTSITTLYPGTTVESLSARQDLSPVQYAEHALKWIEQGASIVGGCCEIGPEHIRVLADTLKEVR